MKDEEKTKEQLINELEEMRERFAKLEAQEAELKNLEEKLIKERQDYKLIIDSSPIIVFSKDKEGRFVRVSKAFAEALEMPEEAFLGKTVFDLYSDKIAQSMTNDDQEVLTSGCPKLGIIEQYESARGIRWVQTDRVPITNKDGISVGLVGFAQDVTERKQMEEALRQSEKKYIDLVEQSNDSILVVQDGLIKYANSKWERITGYKLDGIIDRALAEIIAPEFRDSTMERHKKQLAGEDVPNVSECAIINTSGEKIAVEINANLIQNRGRPATLAIVRDITGRKRREAELQWKTTFLEALVNSSPDGITVVDASGNRLVQNQRNIEFWNIPPEVAGLADGQEQMNWVKNMTVDPEQFLERVKYLQTHRLETARDEVELKNGKILERYASPVIGNDGTYYGRIWTFRDITERKKAEAERLELECKAQNVGRLASIGELAAGIAHEINNPLTPILGFTDMLLKRDIPEDIRADLQIIHDCARQATDTTRRLLLFARQSKPMRTLSNINEVVETVLQLRAHHLKTNNIKVITELDSELPQTMADAGQMQQVVLNLIMNAEYAMVHARGGGNLLIKTEKMGNIICLSVKDDGPGISTENMGKLFHPFFTTKREGEGTGLGLSVCHGIMAEHHGRIYAESEVGKGATLIVELPIVSQQKELEVKLLSRE